VGQVSTALYGPEFFVGRSETVARSAAVVVPILVDLLAPRSVLDIGCGQGEWLEAFGLADMQGVDIAAPEGYLRHDLNYPLALGRTFALVLSLETGEHLPASAAEVYVDSLVRHSRTVVFSAAVPGQEGKGHINCQPHEYWHQKFKARGYTMVDAIRPQLARRADVSPWYRENLFVYLKGTGGGEE
jgi:SAM-dependent methyltransferase